MIFVDAGLPGAFLVDQERHVDDRGYFSRTYCADEFRRGTRSGDRECRRRGAGGQRRSRAERVMVILDSNHTHDHVLAEARGYAPLVTVGQYLIVADTAFSAHPGAGAPASPVGSG